MSRHKFLIAKFRSFSLIAIELVAAVFRQILEGKLNLSGVGRCLERVGQGGIFKIVPARRVFGAGFHGWNRNVSYVA
jgi:hypothetical protein